MNTLQRVFEIVLLKSKNIETAYYYAQKSYQYFIEYMEQTSVSDSPTRSNHTDAVLFVYKKTIYEIYDKDELGKNFHNSFDDFAIEITPEETNKITGQIFSFVNCYFFWNNEHFSIEDRFRLSQFLDTISLSLENTTNMIPYLEFLQKDMGMSLQKYKELVTELSVATKKGYHQHVDKTETLFDKYYFDKENMEKKLLTSTTKDLIKWLVAS